MPPTFSKMCQQVKMSNFSLSRVSITRASSRVRTVVHTSLRCRGHRKVLRVWDFNSQNPVEKKKIRRVLERKFPGCHCLTLFEIRNLLTRRYRATRLKCWPMLYLRKLLRNEELSSVSCLTCVRTLARIYCTFNVKMGLTDLHNSHCVSLVSIKAFSVLFYKHIFKRFSFCIRDS